MVEEIKSQQVFGDASVTPGEPPKHTATGHERCAHYLTIPEVENGFLVCPHDQQAWGGFYSEDYVREIRIAAQKVISRIDQMMPPKLWKHAYVEQLRELTK